MWWGSNFDFDEVLGVHLVLDVDLFSSKESAFNGGCLVKVHILGHFSLVNWDSSSGGGSNEGGDGK